MRYIDLYRECEEKYIIENNLEFKKFIDAFTQETRLDASNLYPVIGIAADDYIAQFYYLKYLILTSYPVYINKFFQLLELSKYDLSSEVLEAIKLIGKNSVNYIDYDIKQYLLTTPYINNITNKSGLFTIHSDRFGDYSFYPIRKYLEENDKAIELITKYETKTFCHQMFWELMKYLYNSSLITLFLPSYFYGKYYHTVIKDEKGLIIDVANESVFDEKTYERLFKGTKIVETRKSQLKEALEEAIKNEDEDSKVVDFPQALLLTFNEQIKRLK